MGLREDLGSGGLAFVFQGGGTLAAPQVGMLRALTEAGIVPDLVVGSSAGALNAAAFASNPTMVGLDRLERLWTALRRKHVAPFSLWMLVEALTGRGDGLVSNTALRTLLAGALVPCKLSEALLPVHVVATDLASGEPVIISDGDTVAALLASCAFPGLYPPVRLGERQLFDGGVSADIPVLQAETVGARVTLILPAAGPDDAQPHRLGPLSLAYRALGQILDAAARRDTASARGPVHMLPAPVSQASNPVDFHDTARLIDQGYRLAANWLANQLLVSDV
jgi:NTE family protein